MTQIRVNSELNDTDKGELRAAGRGWGNRREAVLTAKVDKSLESAVSQRPLDTTWAMRQPAVIAKPQPK